MTNSTSTPGLPFKNVRFSLEKQIPLENDSKYEQFYGLGWAVSELPAPLGQIGINPMFVSEMPVVGKGIPKKRTVWHHNGSLVGFFSSVHILPDTDTAIVVLTKSLANNDCADWIGQLLLETVLDNSEKNDYVKLAEESVNAYKGMWTTLKSDLDKDRNPNTPSRPLDHYTGKYYNRIHNWFLDGNLDENQNLIFGFQGLASKTHQLRHYKYDVFTWEMTAEESIAKGRWPDLAASVYLLYFESNENGDIIALKWIHDWAVPEGEILTKKDHTLSVDSSQNVVEANK